jgi:hypothetical protein
MRDYFLKLLQNLDKLTGMKQYEKLCQMKDFKTEINTLLDILCRVCEHFQFIPDDAKKQIIDDAVISDQEFIGLNAKFIAKSLNAKKEFYLSKKDDVVISPDALTGEAREARLKEWQEALNKFEVQPTQRSDVYAKVREEWKPKDGVTYKPTMTAEDILRHELHIQYVRENYHPLTKEKLPHWMPENQWIELQKA